jgi:CRISPR/Cas system CSM-associated protein Csm2 small subunit
LSGNAIRETIRIWFQQMYQHLFDTHFAAIYQKLDLIAHQIPDFQNLELRVEKHIRQIPDFTHLKSYVDQQLDKITPNTKIVDKLTKLEHKFDAILAYLDLQEDN